LKVHIEGHVPFLHFKDANVLVDVISEWPALALPPTFPLRPNGGINYFSIKGAHSHYVFVFSVQEVLSNVSSISIECIHF
jgi:hypothetical protein